MTTIFSTLEGEINSHKNDQIKRNPISSSNPVLKGIWYMNKKHKIRTSKKQFLEKNKKNLYKVGISNAQEECISRVKSRKT